MRKYITALTLAAALLASGCTSTEINSAESENAIETAPSTELGTVADAMTEIAWEGTSEPQHLTEPPIMRLETIGAEIASCTTLYKCGYSWDNDGEATIACGASPYQAFELGHINAVIDISDIVKAPKVLLTNGGEISSVYCWNSDEEVQEIEFTEDGEILLTEEPIGSVYEVCVKFPQGTCSYVFATEKREKQDTPISDTEQSTPPYEPVTTQTSAAFQPEEAPIKENADKPEYQIIRTSWSSNTAPLQNPITISSAEELSQYISENNENGSLDSFIEATSKYDDSFFAEKALVLVQIEESSGSITHEVTGYTADGIIQINTYVPMVGTCDMAYYHILVEIPQDMADIEFGYETEIISEDF